METVFARNEESWEDLNVPRVNLASRTVPRIVEGGNEEQRDDSQRYQEGQNSYFACLCCSNTFANSKDLTLHEFRTHFSWMVKPYNLVLEKKLCDIVKKACRKGDKFGLRDHLNVALDEFENKYDEDSKCVECEFATRSRDDMVQHFKVFHVTLKKRDDNNSNEVIEQEMLTVSDETVTKSSSLLQEDTTAQASNACRRENDSHDHTPNAIDQGKQDDRVTVPFHSFRSDQVISQNNSDCRDDFDGNAQGSYEFVNLPDPYEVEKDRDENTVTEEHVSNETQKQHCQEGRRKTNPSDLRCGHCDTFFENSARLTSHVMAKHFPDARCVLCGFDLKASTARTKRHDQGPRVWALKMGKHMMSKHKMTLFGTKGYPCLDCNYICISYIILYQHKQRKHPEKYRKGTVISCSLCKYTFISHEGLERHMEKRHKRTFRCSKCPDVVLSSKAPFNRHLMDTVYHITLCQTCGLPVPHSETREGSKHQCPAQFGNRKFKPLDKFGFSGDKSGNYVCHLCNFACDKENTMRRHKSLMHLPQKCPLSNCNVTAPDRLMLKTHISLKHCGMCSVCAYVKMDDADHHNCAAHLLLPVKQGQGNLSDNAMIVHVDRNVRPAACVKCFNISTNTLNAIKHMKACLSLDS